MTEKTGPSRLFQRLGGVRPLCSCGCGAATWWSRQRTVDLEKSGSTFFLFLCLCLFYVFLACVSVFFLQSSFCFMLLYVVSLDAVAGPHVLWLR